MCFLLRGVKLGICKYIVYQTVNDALPKLLLLNNNETSLFYPMLINLWLCRLKVALFTCTSLKQIIYCVFVH
jgi:hypothetical protein